MLFHVNMGKETELTFNQSVERLSEITSILEEGVCELEDIVSLYEEGMLLVKSCQGKIDGAKMTIEKMDKEFKK